MSTGAASMFFRHLWIRLVAVERQPQGLGLLVAAALSSIVLWPLLVDAGQARHPYELLVSFLTLFLWPLLVALPMTGAATAAGRDLARGAAILPALPLGPRTRVLAEGLGGLLLVLILRQVGLLLGAAGAPLFGAGRGVADAVSFRAAYLANNAHGLLLTLPVVLAWASPGFGRWSSLAKAEVAALVMGVLLVGGVMRHPRLGAVVCLVVAGLVLAAVGREPRFDLGRLFVSRRLWRRSPGAAAQLRQDQWHGPLAMGAVLALSLELTFFALLGPGQSTLAGWLHCRPALLIVVAWAAWSLLAGFLFVLPLGVLVHPLGVNVIAGHAAASGGLRRAPFAAAWACLPVAPGRLTRAVYLHGLGTALVGCLMLLAHTLLTRLLGLSQTPRLELTLGAFPATLAVAGWLVCLAVGDRRRGAQALLSLVGVLVCLPLTSIAANLAGLTTLPARVTLIASVTLALSLVGGLPPLVHLRRPSRPA